MDLEQVLALAAVNDVTPVNKNLMKSGEPNLFRDLTPEEEDALIAGMYGGSIDAGGSDPSYPYEAYFNMYYAQGSTFTHNAEVGEPREDSGSL